MVQGTVVVTANAFSGDLLDVVLEVGAGLQPATWTQISRGTEPVISGAVGAWETTEFEDGLYTLRLTVRDRTLGAAQATIILTVRND